MKKKKRLGLLERRRTIWEKLFFYGVGIFLTLWSAIVLVMLAWAVMSAFKTNLEYVNYPLALPKKLHWENFLIAMEEIELNGVSFWGMFYNSMWQTVIPPLISITTTLATGYVFAHYEFPGRSFLWALFIFVMILPLYGSFSASYKLLFQLGWPNSYKMLILSISGFGGGTFLLTYGHFKGVPKELKDAVYIDGGSDMTALMKVYLPLSRNIFVALYLLAFIGGWNDFGTALLYYNEMPNLAYGLYEFQQEIIYVANNPAYFAGSIILMIPIVVIFILYSDKIMGQLYSGGIKG